MKGFETNITNVDDNTQPEGKKECPAMKGFETRK